MEDRFQFRVASNADGPAVRSLVYAVLREYEFSPDPEDTDADLADLGSSYLLRGGTFEVLFSADDRVIGTVGLYPLADGRCELRKMYLLPEYRGLGLGKRLLRHAIERARPGVQADRAGDSLTTGCCSTIVRGLRFPAVHADAHARPLRSRVLS